MFLLFPFNDILSYFLTPVQIYILYAVSLLLVVVLVCLFALKLRRRASGAVSLTPPLTVLIVLGSGGHTNEMLRLVANLGPAYRRRIYCIADTDSFSHTKLLEAERKRKADGDEGHFEVVRLPRAREVRQSYITSVMTTLLSIQSAFPIVYNGNIDLVLCNGPGTCIPLCGVAFLLDIFYVKACQIVFVESLCRVTHLSLSGEILYQLGIADKVLVQWPQLKQMYDNAEFIGRLF